MVIGDILRIFLEYSMNMLKVYSQRIFYEYVEDDIALGTFAEYSSIFCETSISKSGVYSKTWTLKVYSLLY